MAELFEREEAVTEIALVNKRGIVLVDNADVEWISQSRWYLHNGGYAVGRGGSPLMHRFIMEAPREKLVDHRNGNKLDNRRDNLRVTDYSINGVNRHNFSSKTGIQGVQEIAPGKSGVARYRVHVWRKNVNYYLGTVATLEKAIEIRAKGELLHYGEILPPTKKALESV